MDTAELITRVNILDFAESYGLELEYKNGEYWGLSPFKKEKTPSFAINVDKQAFYDFSSGKGGNILELIKELEGCNLTEAITILKGYAGIIDESYNPSSSFVRVARKFKPSLHNKGKSGSPEILPDAYMNIYSSDKSKLREWIAEGMSYEVLERFQVRYDSCQNRIVFPIRNVSGKIVNICGRTLNKNFKEQGERKYTYYKKWNGEMNVLFGYSEHKDIIKNKNEIILFEGAKSVFLAETWGYDNACALLTSHLSEAQFRILIKLGVNVVIAFDEDVNPAEDKNIQRLKRYCRVSVVKNLNKILEEKMSPVDKGKETWKYLYERRRKLS